MNLNENFGLWLSQYDGKDPTVKDLKKDFLFSVFDAYVFRFLSSNLFIKLIHTIGMQNTQFRYAFI